MVMGQISGSIWLCRFNVGIGSVLAFVVFRFCLRFAVKMRDTPEKDLVCLTERNGEG